MHAKTLLSVLIAAMMSGGAKEACESHVIVAAPKWSPSRDVTTYIPFEILRKVFCLTLGSIVLPDEKFRDFSYRSKIIDLEIIEGNLSPEFILQMQEQVDEFQ
jgi:hypothetical protein